MKYQVTCSRCGFVAFVDKHSPNQLAGWRIQDMRLGLGVCPACISEEEPAEPGEAMTA